jgi:hypothetical protein
MARKRKVKARPVPTRPISHRLVWVLSIITAIVYFFSNPKPQSYYDYTFRVAGNLLRGGVAFVDKQPSWLNEFVPFEGFYYSVFPFGAVLSMVPVALLKALGIVTEMPGALLAALMAAAACFLLLKIASHYETGNDRRILLAMAMVFGTFMWTNLTFAGAWQLALGFAFVGEAGALYFTVYDRRPFLAGIFFALAFGNRTENLLTAPVFLYLLFRPASNRRDAETPSKDLDQESPVGVGGDTNTEAQGLPRSLRLRVSAVQLRRLAAFCVVPFALGVATLAYNYIRFHSFTDFGYARIPGVLQEPWYDHGIFSTYYIPRQAWEMLVKSWEWRAKFPYLVPDGFSSSILFSSPFLILVFRLGSRDKMLKIACWISIIILTFLLWIHGNSGGWQFGYRYSMVLLPWIFVILLESAPKKITPVEWTLYGMSFVANAYATWLFHWTEYMK